MKSTTTTSVADIGRFLLSRPLKGIILMTLVVVGAIAWINYEKPAVEPAPDPPRIDHQTIAKGHVEAANLRAREAQQSFKRALAKVTAAHAPPLTAAAEDVSRKASEYETIGYTLYYLASDQFSNGTRTNTYLTSEIGPLIDPAVYRFSRNVSTELNKLEVELRRITVELAVALASLGPGDPPMPTRIDTEADINREFMMVLSKMGVDAALSGFLLMFDLRPTARIAQMLAMRVATISSQAFYRQVARLLASWPLPIIDGPFPIGDVVAIVSAIASAYEILSIKPQFEHDLRVEVLGSLSRMRNTVIANATAFAENKVSKVQELHSKMGTPSAITVLTREVRK